MKPALALLVVVLAGCQGRAGVGVPAEADEHTAGQAEQAMAGMTVEDLHLRLSAPRPATAADSARAAEVLATMRRELVRYRDVRVATAEGFRQFLPGAAAPVQHFTKFRWAMQSRTRLDPARPTSLLYERGPDGQLVLVGAMFTAPPQTGEDELNARLPLGVVRWHQHVNWCIPPIAQARERWRETKNGQPVFGPKSPIATADACAAVGGRFYPRLFGWMVHVMAFKDGDPWQTHEHGGEAHHH